MIHAIRDESMYQTFISYRRRGGSEFAARLYDYLREKKFEPFYDITEMECGRFDEQLRITLINAKNFVLVLSNGALDRVVDEEDWVRQEVRLAIECNLNIVVHQESGFVFPSHLPPDIANLTKYQALEFDARTFAKTLPDVASRLIRQVDEFMTFDPLDGTSLNLTGEYITLYEDNDNGRKVVIRAPASLRVRWGKVRGVTKFGSQSWKLKGQLYNGKRIAGVYYARNVLDDGLGTFYLEVKSPSILEGFWCGYDNTSHQISAGKYLFKKIYSDYTIRAMRPNDLGQVITIADAQLGKDYVSPELLSRIMSAYDRMWCSVVVDNHNQKIIGFCIAEVISYEKVLEITKGLEIREFMFSERIGYLKTIAIDRRYTGYGIASKVVSECLIAFKEQGANACISTAWKHGGKINIENVLVRNGFAKHNEIPNYWYELSVKEKFMCPQCGNPCHCSCVVFVKC